MITFKEAYKKLKKLPDNNYLHSCYDCGDLWELVLLPEFLPPGEMFGGGGVFINKNTGEEILDPISVYADPNRPEPRDFAPPLFAHEGWDYYDDKTNTFKLKPNAPNWAKKEFENFYGSDESEYKPAQLAHA
jgi:hypothetical protein